MNSRLDILIYAHDGRGLGHISRSVAIGMALRRFYPELKILFISGSSFTTELIDSVALDWLKLPAYATRIIDGRSRGITGPSNFQDHELGQLRAEAIKQVVELYRPRVVLCDHSPRGKHRELLPAQEASKNTQWVLGVRGVVGAVPQVFSDDARETFKRYFGKILWYGDQRVLGRSGLDELNRCFDSPPVSCGYVSRLAELVHRRKNRAAEIKKYAGTISIPWQGEQTLAVVEKLAKALQKIGPQPGRWNIFLGTNTEQAGNNPGQWFKELPHVHVRPPGSEYAQALTRSKTALIYGGYNSITDVLSLNIPSVVLLRAMQDEEQQQHLGLLARHTGNQFSILPEDEATPERLEQLLRAQMDRRLPEPTIKLNGAETAAHALVQTLTYSLKR